MIKSAKTKIIIVPDFVGGREDATMTTLKEAIEGDGEYVVELVDLPSLVRADHVGVELTEAKVIELSAKKLEQILKCGTNDYEKPDALVVFGKSVMLAGGAGRTSVLFVNPEYDWEWPWKKQYYTDRKLVAQFNREKFNYESKRKKISSACGTEKTGRYRYSSRYGIITNADCIGEFWDHYPQSAEVARHLQGDTRALAKFVCEFASDTIGFPLEEVYNAIENLPISKKSGNYKICDFIEPVKLNTITVLGVCFGVPMAIGQSCYKLRVVEYDFAIPLESITTRRELNLLRDAINSCVIKDVSE